MNSYLNHLQINIDYKNIKFYKELMEFLGWKIIMEDKNIIGYNNEKSGSIWFLPRTAELESNYNGSGVNHIGIGVDSIGPVDDIVDYLWDRGIKPLFGTPRYRPEFSGDKNIYYQIMFESPDKILFEVVCAGPKG